MRANKVIRVLIFVMSVQKVTQLKIRHNPFAKAFQDARDRPNEINNNSMGTEYQSRLTSSKVSIGDSPHSGSSPGAPNNWCNNANMAYSQPNLSSTMSSTCMASSGGSSLHCERLSTLRSHRSIPYNIERTHIKRSPSPYGMSIKTILFTLLFITSLI